MNESLIQPCHVEDECSIDCKLHVVVRIMTYTTRKVLANSVPAAAVIQKGRALSGFTGRKTHVGRLKGCRYSTILSL